VLPLLARPDELVPTIRVHRVHAEPQPVTGSPSGIAAKPAA